MGEGPKCCNKRNTEKHRSERRCRASTLQRSMVLKVIRTTKGLNHLSMAMVVVVLSKSDKEIYNIKVSFEPVPQKVEVYKVCFKLSHQRMQETQCTVSVAKLQGEKSSSRNRRIHQNAKKYIQHPLWIRCSLTSNLCTSRRN